MALGTAPKLKACLWFDTQAEDAARHYTSIFKNSRIVSTSHYGDAGPRPAGTVMTVEFELDGQPFMALNGGPEFTFSEAVSYQISCKDQAEADYFWDRLVEGGEESRCGWLKDKFGFSWQVTPTRLTELLADPDPRRAQAALKCMLGQRRIVIAEIEAAADAAT